MKILLTSILLLPLVSVPLTPAQPAAKANAARPGPNPFLLAPDSFRKQPSLEMRLDRARLDPMLLSAAIFHATNAERARHRLPPLAHSEALRRAAQGHSRDMAVGRFFSHKNPKDRTRKTMEQRLALEGVTEGLRLENIAKSPVEGLTYRTAAEAIVAQWMNSRSHRRAILNRSIRYLGCAVQADLTSPHFYVLATQNFSSALPEAMGR